MKLEDLAASIDLVWTTLCAVQEKHGAGAVDLVLCNLVGYCCATQPDAAAHLARYVSELPGTVAHYKAQVDAEVLAEGAKMKAHLKVIK